MRRPPSVVHDYIYILLSTSCHYLKKKQYFAPNKKCYNQYFAPNTPSTYSLLPTDLRRSSPPTSTTTAAPQPRSGFAFKKCPDRAVSIDRRARRSLGARAPLERRPRYGLDGAASPLPMAFHRRLAFESMMLGRTARWQAVRRVASTPTLPDAWQATYDAADDAHMMLAYRDWAPTYDRDSMDAFGYAAPRAAAELLCRYLHSPSGGELTVLDAGAGTGLVGQELFAAAARHPTTAMHKLSICGVDFSPDMLAEAGKKVRGLDGLPIYSRLLTADLNTLGADLGGEQFDAVVCVGTLTPKHCGPTALDELVCAVKPGGLLVFTLRLDYYEDAAAGMKARLRELEGVGKGVSDVGRTLKLLERTRPALYTPRASDEIRFCAWAYEVHNHI
jgi:SAM-dependent methyltransferase